MIQACISAGRPGNVAPMEAICGELVWFVPESEVGDYRKAGAVTIGVDGLSAARNAAIDFAQTQGAWCIQTDDDLRRLRWRDGSDASWTGVVGRLIGEAEALSANLAGVAPTPNPYFARRDVTTWGFILGSLCAISPTTPLRFSTSLRLKEDWDYTCAHLARYGHVARVDAILADYRHYTNRGGAVAYRDDDSERDAAAWLLARWPDLLAPHGRRPNELRLRRP